MPGGPLDLIFPPGSRIVSVYHKRYVIKASGEAFIVNASPGKRKLAR